MPINFGLVSNFNKVEDATPNRLVKVIEEYLSACAKAGDAWPNFSTGNHDCPRTSTRFGPDIAPKVLNTLLMLLPGTPLTYYGEEIGMKDNPGGMGNSNL